MRLNLPLLARSARRLISGGAPPLTSLAQETWTLCAEEQRECDPAVYLEGALDRVTTLSPWRTWDSELALIRGGLMTHAASTAHLIPDVDVVGGFVYKASAKARVGVGEERFLSPSTPAHVTCDEGVLVTSWPGSHFFGLLLQCDFALELISPGNPNHFTMVSKPYEHAAGYRTILGLPPVPRLERARIRRLVLYTDFAQNSFKSARYTELRSRLRRSVAPSGAGSRRGVYLQRGRTGELRLLLNEPALIEFLEAQGFEIVEPSRLSAEEVGARTLDAPLVISVEGSHLSHAIFTLADRGSMLVLQPPDRFAMAYKEFTDSLSMRFAFLVGDAAEGGFTIPLDDLRRMLDRLS